MTARPCEPQQGKIRHEDPLHSAVIRTASVFCSPISGHRGRARGPVNGAARSFPRPSPGSRVGRFPCGDPAAYPAGCFPTRTDFNHERKQQT